MPAGGRERLRVSVRGAVQGVGFRPFVFRLATALDLAGWVLNSSSGVVLEVEGPVARLDDFLLRLDRERPPRAVVQGVETARLDPAGYAGFEIRPSLDGDKSALVLPDIASCPDCLADIRERGNRRYRYPFTNCTNCGPRFTIILALPYDRPRTTMAGFEMCGACRAEYEDPRDRRFHAQPTACPACGPQVEAWDPAGRPIAAREDALLAALDTIRRGGIVGLKGLGGFQLVADARNDEAVRRLREAKAREEKPFALMFPSLEAVRTECDVGDLEARLLVAPEAPIVLLQRFRGAGVVCASVAPGNPSLGVMLPYTPLHHLLLADLGCPVVATSGNLADEPICTDEREAVQRLGGMVDAFLVHDRPIARHADDSIARVVLGRELLLRRARGYAPLPIVVEGNALSVLGVGPHLKNTVALSVGRNVFVSQHVGDLETAQAHSAFERVVRDFGRLYDTSPGLVASDAHPDYLSSGFAASLPLPRVQVQHHVAHVAACMAENEIGPPVLGVAWDGTGFGLDGDMWGGECFVAGSDGIRRFAALRSFALPGGDVAAREPRRSALGLLEEWRRAAGLPALALDDAALRHLAAAFDERELPLVLRMLERRVNSPRTTSVGRLFDAVSSLVGLRQRARYEGQAAMELEYASADNARHAPGYPMPVEPAPQAGGDPAWSLNWGPMLEDLLVDLRAGCPAGTIGARFHLALADAVVSVARLAGQPRVVLSGGCFQSRLLTELVVGRLRDAGFRPYWHQRIPPNDGGISLGQVAAAAWGWGIEQQAAGSTQQADSQ